MKYLRLAVVGVVVLSSGCAAIFNSRIKHIPISSNPDGVEVIVDGVPRGRTPTQVDLQPNRSYVVVFKKAGYEDQTQTLGNFVGPGWIVLDVLGGLIPVVIDAATSSWYEFDRPTMTAYLTAVPQAPSAPQAMNNEQ